MLSWCQQLVHRLWLLLFIYSDTMFILAVVLTSRKKDVHAVVLRFWESQSRCSSIIKHLNKSKNMCVFPVPTTPARALIVCLCEKHTTDSILQWQNMSLSQFISKMSFSNFFLDHIIIIPFTEPHEKKNIVSSSLTLASGSWRIIMMKTKKMCSALHIMTLFYHF